MEFIVNIDVEDLKSAERFYVNALGLRAGRHFGTSGIELLGASTPIYLLEKADNSPAVPSDKQARHYSRHWTPVHLDIVVADVEEGVRRATAAGATLERPIQPSNWGKLARMADPFGHGFCLVEFVGRGYDEIATG